MFNPFKCKHPFSMVAVYGDEVVTPIDREFEKVTYRLFCRNCQDQLEVSYARLLVSVEEFLGASPKQKQKFKQKAE